jgi:hypothetical protein
MKVLNTKPFWTSKTMWFNVAVIAMGILQFVQENSQAGSSAILIGIIGVFLRVITTKPLTIN